MKKIIETQAELERKLSDIYAAAQKAQYEKRIFDERLWVVASLIPLLPPLAHEKYNCFIPAKSCDDSLFKGLDTVVVAEIECSADYSKSARRALTFEQSRHDIRCFYADGLYLYYPYVYKEKTHALASLEYKELCREYNTGQCTSLTRPNNIGSVTAKKLQAWTDYYKTIVASCEKKKAEADARLSEFRDKLRTVCPDKADRDEGAVNVNGILFTWEVRSGGYIYTSCALSYEYSYGIDSFIKLVNMNK